MNRLSNRTVTTFATLLILTGLGACGAAHRPAGAQSDVSERFVATAPTAASAGLAEILVQASRLPAAGPVELDEIVVSASRLPDGGSVAHRNLPEIVVSATRLPGAIATVTTDAQVAALLD